MSRRFPISLSDYSHVRLSVIQACAPQAATQHLQLKPARHMRPCSTFHSACSHKHVAIQHPYAPVALCPQRLSIRSVLALPSDGIRSQLRPKRLHHSLVQPAALDPGLCSINSFSPATVTSRFEQHHFPPRITSAIRTSPARQHVRMSLWTTIDHRSQVGGGDSFHPIVPFCT